MRAANLLLVIPRDRPLRLYGAASEQESLPWQWVQDRLVAAGTYWVVAHAPDPHPRPVWGVWHDLRRHLSVGSPSLSRSIAARVPVTVHLDSGTEVVLVEGTALPGVAGSTPPGVIERYNAKYDWDYQVGEYGELAVVEPARVMAWRSGGWAGRDGFQATGRWDFDLSG